MLPSKWENLSRCSTKLIHVIKKTTTCIGLGVEQIFSVNIQHRYFSILTGWCPSQIEAVYAKAEYPHCCDHNLSLVVATACKLLNVLNALDKVNDVSQLFVKGSKKNDTSPKGSVAKSELFKTAESYLQCVHCIRWVEKIDGYNHFLLTYPYIDEAFEVISHKPYLKKYPD